MMSEEIQEPMAPGTRSADGKSVWDGYRWWDAELVESMSTVRLGETMKSEASPPPPPPPPPPGSVTRSGGQSTVIPGGESKTAWTGRRLAIFFNVLAWIVLIFGAIATAIAVIAGFAGLSDSSPNSDLSVALGLLVGGVVLVITFTNYAFLRLAGLIAAYISERSRH